MGEVFLYRGQPVFQRRGCRSGGQGPAAAVLEGDTVALQQGVQASGQAPIFHHQADVAQALVLPL